MPTLRLSKTPKKTLYLKRKPSAKIYLKKTPTTTPSKAKSVAKRKSYKA